MAIDLKSQRQFWRPQLVESIQSLGLDGHFGEFGGAFVPETLVPAVAELARTYLELRDDLEFWRELDELGRTFTGRPTPIYRAERLSERIGGPAIVLKREDLAHTGAHKINNALGQGLLAKRMGRPRIIAETGAGQHGVATATCARSWGSSASFTWEAKTSSDRPRTCIGCGCSARKSARSKAGREL